MTNKSLVWRLQNKLTLEDIEKMLSLKIIDEKEAKELTFNTADDNEKVKSLEEQVKFLKELVEKLSNNNYPQLWTYYSSYTPRYNWSVGTLLNHNIVSTLNSYQYSNVVQTGATAGAGSFRVGTGTDSTIKYS